MLILHFTLTLVVFSTVSGDDLLPWKIGPPAYIVTEGHNLVNVSRDWTFFFYIRNDECNAKIDLRELCKSEVLSAQISVTDYEPWANVTLQSEPNNNKYWLIINRSPFKPAKTCLGKAQVDVNLRCRLIREAGESVALPPWVNQ